MGANVGGNGEDGKGDDNLLPHAVATKIPVADWCFAQKVPVAFSRTLMPK
jgi:hypothetical protein